MFSGVKRVKQTLAASHDIIAAGLSVLVAFYLRLGLDGVLSHLQVLAYAIPLYMLIAGATFQAFRMYRGIWRYASIPDLMAIFKAVTLSILIFFPVMFVLDRLEAFPRSVMFIQWLLLIMALGGSRLLYRMVRDKRFSKRNNGQPRVPVLLVGSGAGAELFIRAVQNDVSGRYNVVGILDERRHHHGRAIHGIPVLGKPSDLSDVVAQLAGDGIRPQRVVVTVHPDENNEGLRQLADQTEALGLKLSRLPSLTEFQEGLGEGNLELRPLAIEDILERPQAPLDMASICALIKGRRVLVTGGGGSIGSELVRQIAALQPATLTVLDNGEYNLYAIEMELAEMGLAYPYRAVLADVRDGERIDRVFAETKPEIVFHAAALKHVPMVEMNPSEAIQTNLIGTRHVADAALRHKAMAMVQISTDKAVNPTNVMGATKRLAEYYCQALDLDMGDTAKDRDWRTHFVTVRFGNVMGSSGSVVPLFRKQLAKGGPLTVTHPEICRYFMTIREAVGLVLQASSHAVKENARRGQIFVLDMGQPVKIVDIARRMIRLAGLEPERDIQIVYTGLRPGEKLYEELFDTVEVPVKTDTPSTLSAMPQPIELAVLRRSFDRLEQAAQSADGNEIRRLLSATVPGYKNETPLPPAMDEKEQGHVDGRV